MTRTRLAVAALLLLAGFFGVRLHAFLAAASGINAKVLCSAVFVSGRSLQEARGNSLLVEPPAMGSDEFPPIMDAPGTYVLEG